MTKLCVNCEERRARPGSYWCGDTCQAEYAVAVKNGETPALRDPSPRKRRHPKPVGPLPANLTPLQRRVWRALAADPGAHAPVVAKRLGCAPGTVRLVRRACGAEPRSNSRPRHDWAAQPLGQVSDHELARRLGCHPVTVREARVRLGIAAWRPGKEADHGT